MKEAQLLEKDRLDWKGNSNKFNVLKGEKRSGGGGGSALVYFSLKKDYHKNNETQTY